MFLDKYGKPFEQVLWGDGKICQEWRATLNYHYTCWTRERDKGLTITECSIESSSKSNKLQHFQKTLEASNILTNQRHFPEGSINHDWKVKLSANRSFSSWTKSTPFESDGVISDNDSFIQIGTLVSVAVMFGWGATKVTEPCLYRILWATDNSHKKIC